MRCSASCHAGCSAAFARAAIAPASAVAELGVVRRRSRTMRHKLLQLILSENGLPIIGWLTLGAIILIALFRDRSWGAALWIVLFIPAIFGTLVAGFALIAGSYALLALLGAAPCVLGLVACISVRPRRSAFTARTAAYTVAFLVAAFIVVMLPRPEAYRVPIAVFDSAGHPVANASISYSVFGGVGANYDGDEQTDSVGRFTLVVYRYEWGHLTVKSPSGAIPFDYYPQSMHTERPYKIEFVTEDESQRVGDTRVYLRRLIATNTNEVLDVHLKPK